MNINKLNDDFCLIEESEYSFLENKTIFLTGGTGLICSYLIGSILKNLSFPIKFIVLSRHPEIAKKRFNFFNDKRVSFLTGDILNVKENVKADFFIHAASTTDPKQYSTSPAETITANVLGLKIILDMACRNKGCKVVFCSSCEVYGSINKANLSENDLGVIDLSDVRSCYNESKRLCELLCLAYGKEFDINYIIPRFSRVYGPTMRTDDKKVISQFIFKACDSESIELKSAGSQVFDYLYVADAARALLFLMKNEENDVFNVAMKNEMSLMKIAEYVANLVHTNVVYSVPNSVEKAGYSKDVTSILDSAKLIKAGFSYKVNLQEGLKRTLNILD